jgi:starch-binding outer membrane protein, SusD/RagB family
MNKLYIVIILMAVLSCGDDYLEEKPDKSLVVPTTLSDLEALLNNTTVMNEAPGLAILGVDDFFMTDEGYLGFTDPVEQYGYIWESDIYHGQQSFSEWSSPYRQIFYANTVLDALDNIAIGASNKVQWETIKGRALFHRAFSHYQLAQLFCGPYRDATVDNPGIPVRLDADIDASISRSSIGEVYDQIIKDLTHADDLLPAAVVSCTQPTSAAAKAMLAIVYTAMSKYHEAEQYASESLKLESTLLDYNELNASARLPISRYNSEVSFHAVSNYFSFPYSAMAFIDTTLIGSYDDNDLRKSIFFRMRDVNRYTFKGNYSGSYSLFVGVAIDEIYLVRAEARARTNNIAGALEDLNTLLEKRWRNGTYIPIAETDANELLKIILSEKQKELVFRPSRWTDLRRLNQETGFQRTQQRKLNGVLYSIPPNDKRYKYPIPSDEITRSGIEQNDR